MLVKDELVTLISLDHKEGTGKTSGKPYSFYVATIGDDNLDKFNVNLDRSVAIDGIIPEWIFSAAEKRQQIVCDLKFEPKGFDIKATIGNIRKS